MGIIAARDGFGLEGLTWEVTKIMQSSPRKIEEIKIDFFWENPSNDSAFIQKLKNAARTCPVALSLDPSIKQNLNFNF
jgi:uncharacterized OsmC-like protein